MGLWPIQRFVLLWAFSLCTGTLVRGTDMIPYTLQSTEDLPEKDIETPITTIPVINPSTNPNPTNPTVTPTPTFTNPSPFPTTPTVTPVTPTPFTTPPMTPTTPDTTPTMTPTTPYTPPTMTPTTPGTSGGSSGGQSWCIASQSASATALQVALDYACGYGGADCSGIQQGGSCFNPDTVRDHASYAFNSYYQKNPVPTSCDFGGTAVLTSVDPSTSTCKFESTSTGSSVLNTTTPTGSTVFGSSPPYDSSGATSVLNNITLFIVFVSLLLSYNS